MALSDDDQTIALTATIDVDLADLEATPLRAAPVPLFTPGGFLGEGAPGAAAASTASKALDGTPYRMVQKLGEGGMGEVYEALDRASGKTVVIKVLHAAYACSPDFTDRMRVEADVLRSLRHPNLVVVHAFDKTPAGRPYLVMERLRGRTLKEELKVRGTIPVPEAIDFVRQALAGLGAAHALGIVHRDVKPDNLFLCEARAGRQAIKVLDFGVAKVLANPGKRRGPMPLSMPTAHGMLVGTPRYAAPEQLRSGPVDARTDVYAAGLVLYTLLAGRGPFESLRGASLLRAGLEQEPEPPSRYAPKPLPRELDRLVLCALAKSPDQRFASADEFGRALSAVADGYETPLRAGAFREGDACGPYRIERLLALGRVTEVYGAVHDFTGRHVALKCVQAEKGGAGEIGKALRAEASVLAHVENRHVARLHDAGKTEHGLVWLAMERLHGKTLRQVLNDAPRIPARDAVLYAVQIAAGLSALAEAHAAHADLRPENVFVTDAGEIKLLDLGHAQAPEQARTAYMPPERLAANACGATAVESANVYELGHILYEMLLGRHAFARSKHHWPTASELLVLHARQHQTPLPNLLAELPHVVWAVLSAALAKDPSHRPTMRQFHRELEGALRVCLARSRPSWFRRMGSWFARRAGAIRRALQNRYALPPSAERKGRGDAIHLAP